jgi:hypothetical protein
MNEFIGDYHPASVCFIDCQHRLKPTPHIPPNLLKQVVILRKPDLSGLRSSAYEFIHRRLSSSIVCIHRSPASIVFPQLPASVVHHRLPASVCFIDCQHRLFIINCQHRLCFIDCQHRLIIIGCQHRLKPTPHITQTC